MIKDNSLSIWSRSSRRIPILFLESIFQPVESLYDDTSHSSNSTTRTIYTFLHSLIHAVWRLDCIGVRVRSWWMLSGWLRLRDSAQFFVERSQHVAEQLSRCGWALIVINWALRGLFDNSHGNLSELRKLVCWASLLNRWALRGNQVITLSKIDALKGLNHECTLTLYRYRLRVFIYILSRSGPISCSDERTDTVCIRQRSGQWQHVTESTGHWQILWFRFFWVEFVTNSPSKFASEFLVDHCGSAVTHVPRTFSKNPKKRPQMIHILPLFLLHRKLCGKHGSELMVQGSGFSGWELRDSEVQGKHEFYQICIDLEPHQRTARVLVELYVNW